MGRNSARARHARTNWTFIALVIVELFALVALLIFAPAAVMTVELLGPLLGFLLQILSRA